MIQRLVEAHWFQHRHTPTSGRIAFWLRECRTVEILLDLAKRFPDETSALRPTRELLASALLGSRETVERKLDEERLAEIVADKAYWAPLRMEIERLRRLHARKENG